MYEGRVGRRDAVGPPLFRYERRVFDRHDGLRSVHVTFSPTGEPVVLHQADHTVDYELVGFREVHAQTGLVGEVVVADDGAATFSAMVDGRTRTRVEAPGDPLHVGPTLFGYVLENWDSLVAGDVHPIRFVVMKNRRSYAFELEVVHAESESVTFEMRASQWFVRLGVPSMELAFDRNRDIVRYAGLVPPLDQHGDHLKRLNATVTYVLESEPYR